MSLFFEVLSAINNPDQKGSIADLQSMTQSIQNVAGAHGVQPDKMQAVLSNLGSALGPALQQKQLGGLGNLGSMLGQMAGGGGGASSLESLLPASVQQQIAVTIAQKVGLDANMVQGMLPMLLPTVMNLLNMGSSKSGAPGMNPLLAAFLQGGAGGNDLGTVIKFANRFLQP